MHVTCPRCGAATELPVNPLTPLGLPEDALRCACCQKLIPLDEITFCDSTQHCNHTMHLTGSNGKPIGSWTEEISSGQVCVLCRYCGKFYGYKPEEYTPPLPTS